MNANRLLALWRRAGSRLNGRPAPVTWSEAEKAYAGATAPYFGRFQHAELMRQAQAATGLSDWGGSRWSEVGFRRRLATLCAALDGEAGLSEIGRSRAHSRLHTMLVSRLLVCGARNHRETSTEVASCLVGTGLPRSGTSFLQQLIAQDPDNCAATTAEALIPAPPLGPGDDALRRATLVERLLEFQGLRTDDISAIHPQGAEVVEEDILLQEGACGQLYLGLFHVPSFSGSLSSEDIGEMYRWQRGLMELIQSARPVTRWVLKAPMHMANLSLVKSTFPDPMLFCNHRDPGKAIPSLASLFTALQRLNSRLPGIDPKALGPLMLAVQMQAVDAMNAWRDAHPQASIVDIQFVDLTRDPIGEVERIYGAYGLPLGRKARESMSAFLRQNPHGREHGGVRHRYELADFGLSPALIEQSCGAYFERYQVVRETGS